GTCHMSLRFSVLPPARIVLLIARHSCLHRSAYLHHRSTPDLHTLSLHDALPILFWVFVVMAALALGALWATVPSNGMGLPRLDRDRKSTRLNSSHVSTSYAVFRLKKKQDKLYRKTHGPRW